MIDFFKKLMEQALDLELAVRFTKRDGEWFAALGGELDGLSLAELEAHYADCAQHDWECCVEPQADSAIRAVEHGSLRFDTSVSGEGYYIVYSWGSGLPFFQEFDLRGH